MHYDSINSAFRSILGYDVHLGINPPDNTKYQETLQEVQSFKMSVPDSHQQSQSDINPDSLDARALYQQENLRLNTIHSLNDVKKHFNP